MLKYDYIIERLTDSQKIRLLTDIGNLSRDEFSQFGIPGVNIGNVRDFARDVYPSAVNLANSWDTTLIRRVSEDIYSRMMEKGFNHAQIPSTKIKISPYRYAISEDPYLAAAVAGEYLAGAERVGITTSMPGFSVTDDEIKWLDEKPDGSVLAELLVNPYRYASSKGRCRGVITENKTTSPLYKEVNHSLADAVISDRVSHNGAFSLSKNVSADETVKYISEGRICVDASAQTLSAALNRYKKLKNSITAGNASVGELDSEVQNGKAIAPETIDEAVDRLLDFAFSCNEEISVPEPDGIRRASLSARAARESIVLLKNASDTLPLRKLKKICVIGDILVKHNGVERSVDDILDHIKALGVGEPVFCRGYDMERDRSESLITSAVSKANESDAVIVFLGTDDQWEKHVTKNENLALPANQIALLDALRACKKRVIAVISGEYAIDVSFDRFVAALLVAPLNSMDGVKAALDAIAGETNPCGRLSSTFYRHTETSFAKQRSYRLRHGLRAGRFIGYRYYDTTDFSDGYPFGFGLSYTKFEYSKITVVNGIVTFTVKNVGKRAGVDIPQLYVGIKDSKLLRPKKELVGFERIELFPGEAKVVNIPLRLPEIYDPEQDKFVDEKGKYAVCICSSATKVEQETEIFAGDVIPKSHGEVISDYLQSESNIITHNYTLEANYKLMKKSVKNLVFGIAAIVLALGIKIYCSATYTNAPFLDFVSLALAGGAIIMFVLDYIDKKRAYADKRAEIDKANEKHFSDAKEVPMFSASEMFVEEFDSVERASVESTNARDEDRDNEYFMHLDKELSFSRACEEFEIYAKERGYTFDQATIREIFASMSASRLMIIKGMSNEAFLLFMTVLCEYFDSRTYIDRVDSTYINEDHALFGTDDNYHRVKKELLTAIESARNTKHIIHFAALTNVKLDSISNYFVPFARYVRNPLGNSMVLAMNENNMSTTYYMPQNLWIVLNLAPTETLDNVPDYISDIASVNSFEFSLCDPIDTHTDIKRFKYPQLDYLNGQIKTIAEIDEDNWKKLDRLEEYVNSHVTYSIGNKLWTGFEKYIATYIACDGERSEAMDKAIAARLLPSMIAVLCGKLTEDDQSISDTLDSIFGEENTASCRRMIQIAAECAEEEELAEMYADAYSENESEQQTEEAQNGDAGAYESLDNVMTYNAESEEAAVDQEMLADDTVAEEESAASEAEKPVAEEPVAEEPVAEEETVEASDSELGEEPVEAEREELDVTEDVGNDEDVQASENVDTAETVEAETETDNED